MLCFPDTYDDLRGVLAKPDHLVIFYHLHKTAGTTLENALRAHYGPRALRCHTAADRRALLRRLQDGDLPPGGKLIYGHFAHALTAELAAFGYRPHDNLFRLTFLRHPLARIESLYAFMKLRDPMMTDTMAQFLARYRKNTATDFFGARTEPEAWLRTGVDFVGICEAMEQSLALLFQMLDVPLDEIPSHNVNTGQTERISPDLAAEFLSRYRSEFTLYEVARVALRTACDAHQTRGAVSTATVASVARAVGINTDLEANSDSFSLNATAASLFDTDPDRALVFFRKAIALNPAFTRRAGEFLRPRDPARLAQLEAQVRADLAGTEDPLILRMLGLLAPELPPDQRTPPPVAPGKPDPADLSLGTAAGQVMRLHWATFARMPTLTNLDRWTARMADEGGGTERLAEEFVATAAFTRRFGTGSSSTFVQKLYRLVLGREADRAGSDTWVQALDSGMLSRAAVLRGLAESAEFRARVMALANRW